MVIYSVIQKRVFTPLRDLPTRIIEAIDHSSNSTMAFAFTKNPRIFCKCKCHCWAWRMVDSLYYSSRKTSERCENSFVNYRIYYQKLCYSLRRIWTKPLHWYTSKGLGGYSALWWYIYVPRPRPPVHISTVVLELIHSMPKGRSKALLFILYRSSALRLVL